MPASNKVQPGYLIKVITFMIGFIIIFLFLGKIFEPKWYYDTAFGDGRGYTDSYKAFFEEDKNTIDVLFLGASTGLNSFLPIELYKETGITSYNLCSGYQMMETSYYLLKEACFYQKPKCLVIDVSSLTYDTYFMETEIGKYMNNYKTITQLPNVINRYSALKKIKPLDINIYEWMLPLIKYHERWTELTPTDFNISNATSAYPSFYKGSFIEMKSEAYWGFKENQSNIDMTDTSDYCIYWDSKDEYEQLMYLNSANLSEEAERYFKKIVSLSEENNIELICVKGPTIARWSEEKHNSITDYLYGINLNLIDYNYGNAKININWMTETPDHGLHVNYQGALKTTYDIGKRLMALGILADHRGEDIYADWDKAVEEYDEYVWERLSTGNEKAYRFMDNLVENYQSNKNKVILISIMDDVSDGWNDRYDDYRRKLGLNTNLYDNYRCSYAAVIEDGTLIYENSGDKLLLYHDEIYDNRGISHKLELISAGMGQGNYCNIKIDDVEYACGVKGLNIVVYDKDTNTVDKSVAIDTFGDGYFYEKQ